MQPKQPGDSSPQAGAFAESFDDVIAHALRDPEKALIQLDRMDCSGSLLEFTRRAWPVLEPSNRFVSGWAIEAIAEHLEAVTRGEIKRLLINVPPGFSKSMLTNVLWPAWEWGPCRRPHLRYISASYDKALSVRDLVRCRDLITSKWYTDRWPLKLKDDEDGKEHYTNTATGWRVARSVGSGLTGWRSNRFIIDDPHSVRTAESDAERLASLRWFSETVPTRFNDQGKDALVVIMQRLHQQDISGHILEKLKKEYTCLILPMEYEVERHCTTSVHFRRTGQPFSDLRKTDGELLWPERFDRPAVDSLKETLSSFGGSYAVAGQLQQRPVSREGGLFSSKNIQIVESVPEGARFVRGWDLAGSTSSSSPFSSGVKMCRVGKTIYISDVKRFRRQPQEMENLIVETARIDGYGTKISLPQDPGQAGKYQRSAMTASLLGYDVHSSTESGDKTVRAIPLAAQWEAGNVVLVRGEWNDGFLSELTMFPASKYKDQVDAATRAFGRILTIVQEADEVGSTAGELYEED